MSLLHGIFNCNIYVELERIKNIENNLFNFGKNIYVYAMKNMLWWKLRICKTKTILQGAKMPAWISYHAITFQKHPPFCISGWFFYELV